MSHLIKLHGSCSWRFEESKNQIAFDASESNMTPLVVLPRKQKFAEVVLNEAYYSLLRLYANELDKENVVLIVFGFSFEDEHILSMTKRALKNPTLQILIFVYEQKYVQGYEEKFATYPNVQLISLEEGRLDFSTFNAILEKVPPCSVQKSDKTQNKEG
ncbi:MAG: SIR2 family protein [Vampirovibrionales bacterium]